MVQSYKDGGSRSLISLGQMLREILQEVDFVGDLEHTKIGQCQSLGGKAEHVRTMTFVLTSAVITESLLIRSLGDRLGSR